MMSSRIHQCTLVLRKRVVAQCCLMAPFAMWIAMGLLPAIAAGPDWWTPASADAAWTNKPLTEVQAAAERGDAAGQYYMARACFLGLERPSNPAESLRWLLRSAGQGYTDAQFKAACCFYDSVGTHHDHDQGFSWVKRAVDQGHADAMGVLGWAYTFGEGVPVDGHKAREWLERAVQGGARSGPGNFARYYLAGEGGLARETNFVEALRWFERAASNGGPSTALSAAELCAKGQGTPPDFDRAVRWLHVAVDRGNFEAMGMLASYLASGMVEPRHSNETTIELYRRVAVHRAQAAFSTPQGELTPILARTLSDSCALLWNRYRFGMGTPRDFVAAAEWKWIAHQGDMRRSYNGPLRDKRTSGPLYNVITNAEPLVSTEDRLWREAAILVDEALDQHRAEALHRIGLCYRDGSALAPKQPYVAWAWLNRAAAMHHAPAKAMLKDLETTLSDEELQKAKLHWISPLMH